MTAVLIVDWLGGPKVVRTQGRSTLDLVQLIRRGIPTKALDGLVKRGALTTQEVEHLVIPRRTLAHRKRRHEPLSAEESDRLARIARVMAMADDTLGNAENAAAWMREPNRALDGVRPIDLLDTESGARLVEQVLGRIAYGVYS